MSFVDLAPRQLRSSFLAHPSAGLIAALLTVVGWTTWVIGTRYAMASGALQIDPAGLAVIRFGVAAVLLAPVWLRIGLIPRGLDHRSLFGLLFAGAPFVAFVSAGLALAPAAESAPIVTGLMPVVTGALAAAFLGQRLGRLQVSGLLVILAGIAVIVAGGLMRNPAAWQGYAFFLAGALAWGVYSVSFRKSGLGAIEATALIAVWSFIAVLPWGAGSLLHAAETSSVGVLAGQVIIQGCVAGVFSIVAFSFASTRLGPAKASALTAMTPVCVLVAATVLLGEHFTVPVILGSLIVGCGVVAASGSLPLALARRLPALVRG
ncbi:carboxylate/amino acid/amine transporter [Hartmannibacter diazotrophicus]|uniref:Carboxylate/amino acid/amine transporter n=1 Tax=Hartmannibacter diazotrophicus TaxID=1482074 RepID=A0A2C9DA10_9HYPH|nr:DMT family transporter [Hartmannibacter diazotrophicus]SON57152.1 carboxylate/amino acid/amine transporter [Hartmannibacter diazotrophicus]